MRYVLLIIAASLQKVSKTESLLTHMVYFSVAMDYKSLRMSTLVWHTHYHLFLFACM